MRIPSYNPRLKILQLILAFSFLVFNVAAQVEAVPITSEPAHHLVFQNEFTRVFFVEVPIGKQTLLHEHKNNYVFVTIGDSDVENMPQGKEPVHLELKDGDVRFVNAPLIHVAKNLANSPFKNVTIEILKPGEADEIPGEGSTCSHMTSRASGVTTGQCFSNPILNTKVAVYRVRLDANSSFGAFRSANPHLVIALSGLELLAVSASKGNTTVPLRAGEVRWFDGETITSLRNQSDQRKTFIFLEYK